MVRQWCDDSIFEKLQQAIQAPYSINHQIIHRLIWKWVHNCPWWWSNFSFDSVNHFVFVNCYHDPCTIFASLVIKLADPIQFWIVCPSVIGKLLYSFARYLIIPNKLKRQSRSQIHTHTQTKYSVAFWPIFLVAALV